MSKNRVEIIVESYKAMARNYRPAAPGDGCGGIYLDKEQLADPARLEQEALQYARRFIREEDTREFNIGCCDYSNTRAFVHAIEAARCLCAGQGFHKIAAKLLRMAAKEVGND